MTDILIKETPCLFDSTIIKRDTITVDTIQSKVSLELPSVNEQLSLSSSQNEDDEIAKLLAQS